MRADRGRLTIASLSGVREVAPKMDQRIDEIHGLWDYHAGTLRRLDGKLLNSTGPRGSVWSIQQMKFRGRRDMAMRNNSTMWNFGDNPPLPGIVFPSPGFPGINTPYSGGWSLPSDWPEDPPVTLNSPLVPETPGSNSPAGPTGGRLTYPPPVSMRLYPIPTLIEYDTNIHANGAAQYFRIKKSDATDGGGSAVRVSWDSGIEWMSLRYIGPSIAQGVSNGGLVPLGAWNSLDVHDMVFEARAYPGELGGSSGTYLKTLSFLVLTWGGGFPVEGTATCTVGIKLIARKPEIEMLTDDPVWNLAVKDAL